MLRWPKPVTAKPRDNGQDGTRRGHREAWIQGHGCVNLECVDFQKGDRFLQVLVLSRDVLWSIRTFPSSLAGTEEGLDVSRWDERVFEAPVLVFSAQRSGTSPPSPGAVRRGLWLPAGDKGWPGSCWKDGLPITPSLCSGREDAFLGPSEAGQQRGEESGPLAWGRGRARLSLPPPEPCQLLPGLGCLVTLFPFQELRPFGWAAFQASVPPSANGGATCFPPWVGARIALERGCSQVKPSFLPSL